MYINQFTSTLNQKDLSFEKVNFYNKEILLQLTSTLSTYFYHMDTRRDNKLIKNYFNEENINEDILMTINALINNNNISWSKKYYAKRNAFTDIGIKEMKNLAKDYKNFDLPFYYMVQEPINYKDGDYTEFSIAHYYGEKGFYSHDRNVFLSFLVNSQFITWQRKGQNAEDEFKKLFNEFIKQFSFKEINAKSIHSEIIESKSNFSLYGPSHLEQTFFIVDNKNNHINFNKVNSEDLSFLLLLGEIFVRLFTVSMVNNKYSTNDLLLEQLNGVFVSLIQLSEFYSTQLTNKLPNIQMFYQQ